MNRGLIAPEKCKRICVKSEMEKSFSYTNSLIKIAEIETVYSKKSVIVQFHEDMKNDLGFLVEYINRYPGTDSDLARNANINNNTISKIRKRTYKARSKEVIIALAIALDLTADDKKEVYKFSWVKLSE